MRDLDQVVGKTVKSVDYCVYRSSLTLCFTDGTQLHISTGSTGMHFDRWSTVEYEIKGKPTKKQSKSKRIPRIKKKTIGLFDDE
jgi:hypothetical protein